MRASLVLFLVLLSVSAARADWWDDFADSVASGLSTAGKWIKEEAAPTVREKFNSAKETLQDPETHKVVKTWVQEKAEKVSDFANTEVFPELKKIYAAATSDESKPDAKN